MIANSKTYLADIVKELKIKWPKHRIINIVCHGHSVPAGHFWSPMVDTFNAYPHLLHKKLKERFPWSVINVIVTAFGGENSASGAKRFETEVLVHKPDVITIDYGLNDQMFVQAEIEAYWCSMLEKAKKNDSKVLLLTPTWDVSFFCTDKPWKLNQCAAIIRDIADKNNVGLVDSFSEYEQYVQRGGDVTDLLSGINHPNHNGHELVATAIARYFPIMTVDPDDM